MNRERMHFTSVLKTVATLAAVALLAAGPAAATELENGVTLTLDGDQGDELHFTIEIPPGAQNLDVDLDDGVGDARLYMRLGAPPTLSIYDCGDLSAAFEGCAFDPPQPGTWYIMVYGHEDFSGATLDVRFWECEGGCQYGGEIHRGDVLSGLSAAEHGEIRYYLDGFELGIGDLGVSLSGGTGDADLYLKVGDWPTRSDYDCRSNLTSSEESCSVDPDFLRSVYVMVYAYDAFSGVTLRVADGNDSGCTPNDTTLCIDDRPGDRRFKARLYYDTVLGDLGEGFATAAPLTSLGIRKGGIFSFSDSTNPEVLIKVLNGCSITGYYWVFYAATTTVGFELSVEDTLAGSSVSYINPDLHPANPVTDTFAFDTCGF